MQTADHLIQRLSYAEVEEAADQLVHRAARAAPAVGYDGVFGIPRGGQIPAAIVAGLMGLPILDVPGTRTLIVDDLVDSGATADRWIDSLGGEAYFDALFRKGHSPTHLAPRALDVGRDWIVFPWEIDERGADHSVEDAVRRLIQFVGEDPTRPGLVDTPGRVARAFREMTEGYHVDPAELLSTTFPDRCDEMVVVRGIEFHSLCEHHLLGFSGTVAVAYVPGESVVGLSKLARLVDCFARRFQVQERLTMQIAEAIDTHLSPEGVGVVVTARHSCMGCRGIRKPTAEMVTSAVIGLFKDDPKARAEFMALAHPPG